MMRTTGAPPAQSTCLLHWGSVVLLTRARVAQVGAAHRHALLLIEKSVVLLSHKVDWKGWSINVSDASDRVLLSVLFAPSLGKYIGLQQEICDPLADSPMT